MPLIEFKSELFRYYGNMQILETIDISEFQDFLIMFFKKQQEERQHDLYCSLYPKMVIGQINYIEYAEFLDKKKKQKEVSTEENLKLIERILNGTSEVRK